MKTNSIKHIIAFIGLSVFAVLAAGSMDTGGNSGSNSSTTTNNGIANSEQAQALMPVGSKGHLKSLGDVSFVTVARTKEAHKEFCKTIAARDTDGIKILILQDKLFTVDKGAKVRVLSIDSWAGTSEVRIIDGKNYGETGWVFSQLVIPK